MDTKRMRDCFVGIDVAKNSVAVHVRPDNLAFNCDADPRSLTGLAARLKSVRPALVVPDVNQPPKWDPGEKRRMSLIELS